MARPRAVPSRELTGRKALSGRWPATSGRPAGHPVGLLPLTLGLKRTPDPAVTLAGCADGPDQQRQRHPET